MKKSSIYRKAWPIILFIFCTITFFLVESLYGRTWLDFKNMHCGVCFVNIFFYYLIALFLFAVMGKLHWAMVLNTFCFCVLGLAQMYIIKFRGVPITVFDIFAFRTALNVVNNYDLTLELSVVKILVLTLCVICAEFFYKLDFKSILSNIKCDVKIKRGGSIFACFLILLLYTWIVTSKGFFSYIDIPRTGYRADLLLKSQGVIYNFAVSLLGAKVEKPKGYSAEREAELLKDYDTINGDEQKNPNIIVIMNEAFADISLIGNFQSNTDYMPFIHKMLQGEIDNSITGHMDVSARGGGTCNTEYEFLTGNTCAFFPAGSFPYQSYVRDNTFSLASFLKAQGYTTIGMHPYGAAGYNRIVVYPQLGLEYNYFFEAFTTHPYADYSDPGAVRAYLSDGANYEFLKQKYEESVLDDTPVFIFNVTIQNHGGYTKEYPNFVPSCKILDIDNFSIDNYLSLIQLSDKEIEKLLSYFSERDEEVIVVFFGDHQPGTEVAGPIMELNGISQLTDKDQRKLYQVPFFIWSNYSMETQTDIEISSNYLAAFLLEQAGMQMPEYFSFLLAQRRQFPIVTAKYAIKSNGEFVNRSEFYDELSEYANMQYYMYHDQMNE